MAAGMSRRSVHSMGTQQCGHGEIALIRAREGQVVRPKGPRPLFHLPVIAASERRNRVRVGHRVNPRGLVRSQCIGRSVRSGQIGRRRVSACNPRPELSLLLGVLTGRILTVTAAGPSHRPASATDIVMHFNLRFVFAGLLASFFACVVALGGAQIKPGIGVAQPPGQNKKGKEKEKRDAKPPEEDNIPYTFPYDRDAKNQLEGAGTTSPIERKCRGALSRGFSRTSWNPRAIPSSTPTTWSGARRGSTGSV